MGWNELEMSGGCSEVGLLLPAVRCNAKEWVCAVVAMGGAAVVWSCVRESNHSSAH